MTLEEWQSNWDQLGKDDPMWVVLTDPAKKGNRWDPKDFFATGEQEIDQYVIEYLKARGIPLARGAALDFGCGVGRLTQGLARHFEEVHGVDISPSMVEHARRFNRHGQKVQYHVNGSQRLEAFQDGTIDLIYSNITLQHIEPRHAKLFIAEFLRVLRPGGIALFQTLEATFIRGLFPQSVVTLYRRFKHGGKAYFGMFGIPQREIEELVAAHGGEVLAVQRIPFTRRWVSCRFCVRKK
jgi:2-polyprenyl-3-methyl-5-hydroxy-6-metoxy-1,4-benzoquinol methylase